MMRHIIVFLSNAMPSVFPPSKTIIGSFTEVDHGHLYHSMLIQLAEPSIH